LHDAKKSVIINSIGPGDRSLLYLGGWKVMGASVKELAQRARTLK